MKPYILQKCFILLLYIIFHTTSRFLRCFAKISLSPLLFQQPTDKGECGQLVAALLIETVPFKIYSTHQLYSCTRGGDLTHCLWMCTLRLGEDGKIIKKKILPTVLLKEN